ncbi:MAG: hypothetical protein JNM52_09105, partial [Betaproteobacteria bacterium]|nr:hypothetical protein [Betaproteobacteria bacterium]
RDSRARLVVALMLCLLRRDDHAAQEAAWLLPTDAAVFVPFCEWWEGCEAAWLPLLARLREAPEGLRLPMLLALYFGCTLRKQYAQAATVVSDLLAELGTAPAFIGEGDAACSDGY